MEKPNSQAERVLAEIQHGRGEYLLTLAGGSYVADLESRILSIASWCAKFLDPTSPATSLRPPRLAPHPLYRSRWAAVDDVEYARARDLGAAKGTNLNLDGRVLVYFPDSDLADGAAHVETNGLLDTNNAPPWATWLGYFDDRTPNVGRSSYLAAWIPMNLVGIVSRGIDVNPEQCIAWLQDSKVRLREVLEAISVPGAG